MRRIIVLLFVVFSFYTHAEEDYYYEEEYDEEEYEFIESFYLYFDLTQNYKFNHKIFTDLNVPGGGKFSRDADGSTIGAGYRWRPNFDFEIEYVDNILLTGDLNLRPYSNIKLDIFNTAVRAYTPFSKTVDGFAKGGIAYIRQNNEILESNDTVSSFSDDEVKFLVEVGIDWSIAPHMRLRVSYQYNNFFDMRRNLVGLLWHF